MTLAMEGEVRAGPPTPLGIVLGTTTMAELKLKRKVHFADEKKLEYGGLAMAYGDQFEKEFLQGLRQVFVVYDYAGRIRTVLLLYHEEASRGVVAELNRRYILGRIRPGTQVGKVGNIFIHVEEKLFDDTTIIYTEEDFVLIGKAIVDSIRQRYMR